MKKRTGLDAISKKTIDLWNKVIEKHGNHSYALAVNGLNEVVLCKGYTEEIAKGNRDAQKVLAELLRA